MSSLPSHPSAHKPAPLPAQPTSAWPGSLEKLLIFEQRAARRESLFHPGDLRLPPPRANDAGQEHRYHGPRID